MPAAKAWPEYEKFGFDWSRLNQIDLWTRAIEKLVPGFRYEFVRDQSHRIELARIHNSPLGGIQEARSVDELHDLMEQNALYFQVGRPWAKPPPAWLCPAAYDFWERAALGELKAKESTWGRTVKTFGLPVTISFTDDKGVSVTEHTKMELIWFLAARDATGRTVLELYPFHYVPPALADGPVHEHAIKEWNKDMYWYIEKDHMRPDLARDKLARVNRELHKKLIEIFASKTAAGGIVKVSGSAAHAATIVGYSAEKLEAAVSDMRKFHGVDK